MSVKLHVRPAFLEAAADVADQLLDREEMVREIVDMEDYFVAREGYVPPSGYEDVFRFNHRKRGFVVYLNTNLD